MRRAALILLLLAAAPCQKGEDGASSKKESKETSALPGALPRPPQVSEAIAGALAGLGEDYEPRTRHLKEDGSPKYTNRLILESSPYLRQHSHNPVDWFPWGAEALSVAKELGRPVFLSIGYSTCHWCHVMEEESFEDPEIARYLNEHYVAIKVDREERPDLDSIYMSAVQKLGQSGGWPLNVWLTPEGQPFFGGTYFPPRAGVRGARVGFLTILKRASEQYQENREQVAKDAEKLAAELAREGRPDPGDEVPGAAVLHAAARFYERRFDERHGGLRTGGQKFPSSLPVRFLLRYWRRTQDDAYLKMARVTLEKMAAGGIFDQIGGGFHRYATDPRWRVPHFEKMLYDNAQLAIAYLEGYQASESEELKEVARRILAYAAREMTSAEGAFYSATDADSLTPGGEREEGYFFTWTPAEVREVVGEERAELVLRAYGITERGDLEGRSIPHRPRPLAEVAAQLDLKEARAERLLESAREELYQARSRRPPPLRDEKILTAWNGLMISAFARAAQVLERDQARDIDYLERAAGAAEFVLRELEKDGRLRRSYAGGRAQGNAYLDDYAFFIAGLLDLYEASADGRWLAEAMRLERVLARDFEDEESGGFFLTSDHHEKLLAREKPVRDGAVPSGNSVAAMNLLRLYQLTSEPAYLERADRLLRAFAGTIARRPSSLATMLLAVDFRSDVAKQIVLVTPETLEQAAPFRRVLARTYLPNRVLAVSPQGKELEAMAGRVPLLSEKRALGGEPTAYVCEERRCELPTTDPKVFARQVAEVKPLAPVKGSGGSEAAGGAR